MRAAGAAVVTLLVAGILSVGAPVQTATADDETSSSAAPPPLVVLLDVSGSMSDAIDGVVKLDAAKAALVPIVTSQTAAGNLGIWTYPASGSCDAGAYLHNLGAQSTVSQVLAAIDSLAASGDTPTAAAIRGVVDDLTARGVTEASLLLISDGLSNCGADPCEVAKDIAGSGFDLTVQSVGFDIDAAGRAELECIAGATGGTYFDVEDGDALEDLLADIGTPQLSVTVSASDSPLAGAAMVITATVENPSGLTATDVRVNLAFRDAGPRSVFPAVIPPTYRLGNIPPGERVTREWTITPGVPDRVVDGRYIVTAWASSSSPAFVERLFTARADGYTSDDLGAVFDGIRGDGRSLVILGDSYSSGEGASPFLPGTKKAVERCHRSSLTYLAPVLDAGGIPVDILACSGAVTSDLRFEDRGDYLTISDSQWRADAQLLQLTELERTPGAAVLTLGGNDLGFADIVSKCVTDDCTLDLPWALDYFKKVPGLRSPLTNAYIDVWKYLNSAELLDRRDGQPAPVIVLGYPQLTHATKFGACRAYFDPTEVAYFNELGLALNGEIRSSVAAARAQGYEVYFVAGTASALLPDHSVCAKERWLNALEWDIQQSFHPNAKGYAAITEAVIDWSRTAERVAPSASVMDAARAGEGMPLLQPRRPPVKIDLDTIPTLPLVEQGARVDFRASGFDPGGPVVVQLHSTPMTLASFVADDDGAVTGSVHVPEFADAGKHELVLSGPDPDGGLLERVAPITVTPPTPLWVPLTLVGAAAAAIGALVLALFARRARRALAQPAARV